MSEIAVPEIYIDVEPDTVEEDLLLEEQPVKFGKLRLGTLKNQCRLDKHYFVREKYVKKYRSTVKEIIPAFNKLYKVQAKRKSRYVRATRTNTRSVVRYFLRDRLFEDDTVHSHGIGSVSFYSREYFGTKTQIKYDQRPTYLPIRYYFKPNVDFGYTPLPNIYRESEAIELHKVNKNKARQIAQKRELQQIYDYLLKRRCDVALKLSPSTELQQKVYEAVIQVPESTEDTEEEKKLLREYQFAPIYTIEPYKLNIYQFALRVEYCAEYRDGSKGFAKEDLATNYSDWLYHYWNIQASLGMVNTFVY
jgi:hypothetical protein